MQPHSFLFSVHPSHTGLRGMTLGKRVYPQGEMIGLGSGRRAGMIPAGYKGTMRVVSKFQSLLEGLTIGKFSLGQKTKNQKQQQKLTQNNKRKQNPTKNIENCRDSQHVGSGDEDQKGQSFSKINKISGIFGKTHFTVHSPMPAIFLVSDNLIDQS